MRDKHLVSAQFVPAEEPPPPLTEMQQIELELKQLLWDEAISAGFNPQQAEEYVEVMTK